MPMKTREVLLGMSAVRDSVLKPLALPRQIGTWHANVRACVALCGHIFSPYYDAEGRETLRYTFERVFAPIGAECRHDLRLELLYLYKMYRPETPSALIRPLAHREQHVRKGYIAEMSNRHLTPDACPAGVCAPISQRRAGAEEKLREGHAPLGKAEMTGAKVVIGGQEISDMAQAIAKRTSHIFAVKIWRVKPKPGKHSEANNCPDGLEKYSINANRTHFALAKGCFKNVASAGVARRTVARQNRHERF